MPDGWLLIGKVHCRIYFPSFDLFLEGRGSLTWVKFIFLSDRSASFSARPRGDIQFQRLSQQSSSTSQLQSDPTQTDFGGAHGSSSTITSSAGGSSGGIAGSPQTHMSLEGIGEHTSTPHSEAKRGKQKTGQPNARSESYKECSPKRSRTNRPKSDPSLYEWVLHDFFLIFAYFCEFICRDDVSSPLKSHPDDTLNSSVTTTPGKTIQGTSLDSSSASSEDESFSREVEAAWNAPAEIVLSDAEKKRQEIINGEWGVFWWKFWLIFN